MKIDPSKKRSFGTMIGLILILATGVVFFSLIIPASREISVLRGERTALDKVVQEERS